MQELRKFVNFEVLELIHFSPEPALRNRFRDMFGGYRTAGLRNTEIYADLTDLPFEDDSCDFIYASHILEHISNDEQAIREIARVLRPGGMAVLPVPIVRKNTEEYGCPNPNEHGHVRAPGPDYFDKYRRDFSRVDVFKSDAFDSSYQTWDMRSDCSHPDYVPVCYKA